MKLGSGYECLVGLAAVVVCGTTAAGKAFGQPGGAGGYEFEAVYTGDVLSNVTGGLRTGSRYLDNLDLILDVDTERAWGFSNGTLHAYALYNNSALFSEEIVGDLQVTSNIDAPEAFRVFELWYEHRIRSWSVLAGLYDLNSEFDVNETGGLFLNSSHGIGPDLSQTGLNGPSIFPVSSLTLRVEAGWRWIGARVAILDGVPGYQGDPASNRIDLGGNDGALVTGEVELQPLPDSRIWAGMWRYTADFERPFTSGSSNDNTGWYLGGERSFSLGSRVISAFLRYGTASSHLNSFSDYIGAGVVLDRVLPSRPDDSVGLAVSSGLTGRPYRRFLAEAGLVPETRETVWELTYRVIAGEHLTVQPNFQLVKNPSATSSIDDALIVGLRFELSN